MMLWKFGSQNPKILSECSLYNLSHVYKQRCLDQFPYTEGCQIWTSHQLVASTKMKAKKHPSTCGPTSTFHLQKHPPSSRQHNPHNSQIIHIFSDFNSSRNIFMNSSIGRSHCSQLSRPHGWSWRWSSDPHRSSRGSPARCSNLPARWASTAQLGPRNDQIQYPKQTRASRSIRMPGLLYTGWNRIAGMNIHHWFADDVLVPSANFDVWVLCFFPLVISTIMISTSWFVCDIFLIWFKIWNGHRKTTFQGINSMKKCLDES